jgi:hypothetical protein
MLPFRPLLLGACIDVKASRFQEHLLSRRTLVFVGGRLYYRCRTLDWPEECSRPSKFHSASYNSLQKALGFREPGDFPNILHQYTEKQFTDDGDVLRAMDGILRRMSDILGDDHIQGMPVADLGNCLAFRASKQALRRRPGLPTYSWAGWRGPVLYFFRGEERLWIVFYATTFNESQHSSKRLKCSTSAAGNPPEEMFYGSWHFHTARTKPFPTEPTNSSQALPLPARPYPFLQFWTFALQCALDHIDPITGISFVVCGGIAIGRASLDGIDETMFFHSNAEFEFIILKRSLASRYDALLIEWIGPVAERRGVATLDMETTSVEYHLEWKEIILG